MKVNARAVAYAYGAWCLIWIVLALSNVAELRIGAHLVLGITGAPLSLATFYLPHASLHAIAIAAVLGFVQWVGLVAWWSTDDPGGAKG